MNGDNLAGLTGGDTGCLFLMFVEAGAGNIANCPLVKILTYKNLIYLSYELRPCWILCILFCVSCDEEFDCIFVIWLSPRLKWSS